MAKTRPILLRHNQEIDKVKWDACITRADNGLIYARSFYLDKMSEHWDGLVLGDYEAVMPLTWNKRFTIRYLYQPPFTACLGVFGNDLNAEVIGQFVDAIPPSFRFADIALNHGNFSENLPGWRTRNNFVLDLDDSYENLQAAYSENHRRNIAKAKQLNLHHVNADIDTAISLNKAVMNARAALPVDAYSRLKMLVSSLRQNKEVQVWGVKDASDMVIAAAVFLIDERRAYYILAGSHADGRNSGASHALVDAFIRQYAGQKLILDFEGSDVETVARFYKGFGSRSEPYPALFFNRLPWPVRWLKPSNSPGAV